MDIPYSQLAKGSLLIASPDIDAGIYFRGVIIICEHSPSGSFGLIINKPLEIELPEELINVKEFVNPNVQIRTGGPIQPNQMMLLHASERIPDQTLKLCEGVFLGGDLPELGRSAESIERRGPPGPATPVLWRKDDARCRSGAGGK